MQRSTTSSFPAVHEIGFDYPENPTMFQKPSHAVADTRQPVPVPKVAQAQCDYEGELTIVIGKDCKNVSKEQALGTCNERHLRRSRLPDRGHYIQSC